MILGFNPEVIKGKHLIFVQTVEYLITISQLAKKSKKRNWQVAEDLVSTWLLVITEINILWI